MRNRLYQNEDQAWLLKVLGRSVGLIALIPLLSEPGRRVWWLFVLASAFFGLAIGVRMARAGLMTTDDEVVVRRAFGKDLTLPWSSISGFSRAWWGLWADMAFVNLKSGERVPIVGMEGGKRLIGENPPDPIDELNNELERRI